MKITTGGSVLNVVGGGAGEEPTDSHGHELPERSVEEGGLDWVASIVCELS